MLVRYNESLKLRRRDGRVVEGARLESVFRGNSNVGSNPTLSASYHYSVCWGRSPWSFYHFGSSKVLIPRTAREATSATLPLSSRPPSAQGATVCAVPHRLASQTDRPPCSLASSDRPHRARVGASSLR